VKVGVPKEVKNHEYRVAITPVGAHELAEHGHEVFVERSAGVFERREVETGWRFGGRVQILNGLADGDRVVVGGSFFLEAESRLTTMPAGSLR
jgi:multidrug efflux pump subunit AcrA (membrane-fusion protein)